MAPEMPEPAEYEKTWRDTIVGLEDLVSDQKKTIKALEEVILNGISHHKAQAAKIVGLQNELVDLSSHCRAMGVQAG